MQGLVLEWECVVLAELVGVQNGPGGVALILVPTAQHHNDQCTSLVGAQKRPGGVALSLVPNAQHPNNQWTSLSGFHEFAGA